ncbi:MAG: hypothetical protein QM784_40080 [Polyangiaceae bacterium]
MTASVTIIYAERANVLVVPNSALRFNPPAAANLPSPPATTGRRGRDAGLGDGKPGESSGEVRTVWVKSGLQVRPVSVRLGLSDGSYTELLDGSLKEGEAVAVDAQVSGSAKASTPVPGGTPGGMRRMF